MKSDAPDLIVAAGAAIRAAELCARYDLQQSLDIRQDYLPLAESLSLPAPVVEPTRRSPFTRDPKPTEEEIAAAIRLIRQVNEMLPRLTGPADQEDVMGTEATLRSSARLSTLLRSADELLKLLSLGHFRQWESGRQESAEIKPAAVTDQITLKAYFNFKLGQNFQETYTADVNVPDRLGWFDILPEEQGGGNGAFGIVRRAKDRSSHLGREVALKFPRAQKLKEEWLERVQREAALWRSLSERRHPNIVHLEDLCTDPGTGLTFLVMEYVKGGNLADRLCDLTTKQRVLKVTAVLEDICRRLAFAHENGVVHGDIKPNNILVTEDMQHAKLGDFGHAVAVASRTQHSGMLGAWPFLAPESFEGKKTPTTDVFALGATLYYLLTGEYLFAQTLSGPGAASDWERLARERRTFQPDLSGLAEEIPSWLTDLIRACMEPDSSRRLPNGQAVLDHVLPVLRPSEARRIVITISRNLESQTIDFDMDLHGERSPEKLTQDLSNAVVDDLARTWVTLGELAINRAAQHGYGNIRAVDAQIRALIERIGDDYAHFVLGKKLREQLGQCQTSFLRLIFDAQLAALPWELFRIGNTPLGRRWPMALSPKLHRSIQPPDLVTVTERKLKVLLISDPTGDLEVAKDEILQLKELINRSAIGEHCEVTVADETERALELRCLIRDCDLLHYAGHGVHAPDDLEKSGLLLKGYPDRPDKSDVLRVTELAQFWSQKAPLLIFANACFSTLVPELPLQQSRLLTDTAFGLAQAMLSGGVRTYVGSLWRVPDDGAAAKFTSLFYRDLFAGHTVGQAMLHARLACVEELGEEDLTWARYTLFGEPWTRLPGVEPLC